MDLKNSRVLTILFMLQSTYGRKRALIFHRELGMGKTITKNVARVEHYKRPNSREIKSIVKKKNLHNKKTRALKIEVR